MKKYFSSYWIRSAFYTILQRFSVTLFGFVNFILLVRGLPAPPSPEMGIWALFLAITTIFEMTKTNLLKNAHIRFVTASEDPREKTEVASSSFVINSLITLVFVVLIVLFSGSISVWLNAGKELGTMLVWFIPGLVFMVLFSHFEAIQQSHLDFKGVFAGYFVRQVAFFAALLMHYLLKEPFSLKYLALYQSGSIFLGVITIFIYSKKYLHFRFNPSFAGIKRIFGYGGYIFGSGLLANICANLDQVMTAKLILPGYVGYYTAAARINGLVDIPSYAASEVVFPKASRASVEEGIEKVKYLYERLVAIIMAFTVPAAIFIILFPKLVISLIAGAEYAAGAPILQLYMITGLLRPMQNQAANLLNSIGKPRLNFIINTVALAVYLGMNYICLLQFGLYGAAIGTLITMTIGSIAWYFIMRRQIGLEVSNVWKHAIDTYKIVFAQIGQILSRSKTVAPKSIV